MMNKSYNLTLILGFIGSYFLGHAQTTAPIVINNISYAIFNPAFAGLDEGYLLGTRSTVNQHRFTTRPSYLNAITFNGKLKRISSGFGINIEHEYYQASSKDDPTYIPDPLYGHSDYYYHMVNGNLNYNYQLKLGENTLALGASAGLHSYYSTTKSEMNGERSSKSSIPTFGIGIRYAYKSFYIGGSIGNITTKNHNNYVYKNHVSFITGANLELHKNFILEPSLLINTGRSGIFNEVFKIQNNFIFLKNYNLGAGYNFDWLNKGYHLFAGVQVKQKLGVNVAYQRYGYRFHEMPNNHGRHSGRLELILNYKFN